MENTHQNTISGHSHSFDTGIAKAFGIHAAILYNHIIYWIRFNAHKPDAQMIDGKYWMYESHQQIADSMEYLTVDEVKKAMLKLLNSGLLIKGNYNKNPFDKTGWYTVPNQEIIKKSFTKVPIGTIDNSKNSFDSAIRHDRECHTAPSLYIHNNNIQEEEHNTSLKVPEEPAPIVAMSAKADEVDSSPPPKKIIKGQDPVIKELATALLSAMRDVKPDYKPPTTTAPIETQIDLMIRRDNRKPEEVLDVFRWALSDAFWADKMFKPNPAKYLRDKFDQLQMKMVTRLPDKEKIDRRLKNPPGSTGQQHVAETLF